LRDRLLILSNFSMAACVSLKLTWCISLCLTWCFSCC
jgi:hypothetical protein